MQKIATGCDLPQKTRPNVIGVSGHHLSQIKPNRIGAFQTLYIIQTRPPGPEPDVGKIARFCEINDLEGREHT